jgi:Holliday junction resolvase RusA-like endonuclease
MAFAMFEFLIPQRPVSSQTRRLENLREWKAYVAGEAAKVWPAEKRPFEGDLRVTLVYFVIDDPADVDNIIKPIQDALAGLVYEDDESVCDVDTVEKSTAPGLGPQSRERVGEPSVREQAVTRRRATQLRRPIPKVSLIPMIAVFVAALIATSFLVETIACSDRWASGSIGRSGAGSHHDGVNHLPGTLRLLFSLFVACISTCDARIGWKGRARGNTTYKERKSGSSRNLETRNLICNQLSYRRKTVTRPYLNVPLAATRTFTTTGSRFLNAGKMPKLACM